MTQLSFFTSVYLGSFAVLAVVEGVAIGSSKRGDTISEHFWTLRESPLVWAAVPLVTWTFFHFVMPWEPDGDVMNDLIYLGVGLAIALWNVCYQIKRGRQTE